MTTTKEIFNLMCPNIECGLEKITIKSEDFELSKCPLCQAALLGKTELEDIDDDSESYYEEGEDQHYIDTWNKDLDNFHRQAYGEPTPEEGGIRDYSYDNILYNDAGEPQGYC
jgi:Zn-finger nucleic acid-binding protein